MGLHEAMTAMGFQLGWILSKDVCYRPKFTPNNDYRFRKVSISHCLNIMCFFPISSFFWEALSVTSKSMTLIINFQLHILSVVFFKNILSAGP